MSACRLALAVLLTPVLAGCTVLSRLPDGAAGEAPGAAPTDLVVLVHGMGRTPFSMLPMERHLERAGYRVLNFGYSSVGPDVATIGHRLAEATDAALGDVPSGRVHFVGHSLGGVVVRWVLAHERPARTGRAVLLAPPNQGSASADRWGRYVGWLLRPIRELRTAAGSTVRSLPSDPGVPVLVVAGARDGKVSPAEAHLDGAEAEVVVPSGHTFILMRPAVMRLVERYLGGELPAGPLHDGDRRDDTAPFRRPSPRR
ncbi:MAG TPA: alpha/beta fold hydrolase [Rubricoccaceae bacterium]|jgi:hypothetical protein